MGNEIYFTKKSITELKFCMCYCPLVDLGTVQAKVKGIILILFQEGQIMDRYGVLWRRLLTGHLQW